MRTIPVGIHTDVSAADYHEDPCEGPSLSSSVAYVLLEKTPRHAWIIHPQLNPFWKKLEKPREAFDLGAVAHELILGKGGGFEIINYDDWRTKAAQAARADAYKAGLTPILRDQYKRAMSIRDAVHAAADMERLWKWERSLTEAVLVWEDDDALCRAMLDLVESRIIWDIKTTSRGLSDAEIARTIVSHGYELRAAFYLLGMNAIEPTGGHRFRWVFVESDAPHEVRIIEADPVTLGIGTKKAAKALEIWKRCLRTGHWPGYSPIIGRIEYPAWAETAWLEREMLEAGAHD